MALVAAMLAITGPGKVLAALGSARWTYVGLASMAYALCFAIRGLRWRLLLGPGGAGAGTAALATASGWLVSTFVPMKAGDVVRAAWMGRRHRSGFASVSGTVALERLLDIGGLAVACTLALVLLRVEGDAVPTAIGEAVAIAWLLPALGLVLLVARWAAAGALLLLAVGLLLHYAPERHQPLEWVSLGSLVIIVAWLAMSAAFGFYLTEVASYGSVFGPLATVVVLMGYLYFSTVIFLGGVQLDALARVED
ncbi:MAG: rane protein [Thermoplasmata archaeon]|nr:rane protein [Thermoplasmata archaeon]